MGDNVVKKFILGLLCGVLLCIVIPVIAENLDIKDNVELVTADYSVHINNQEFTPQNPVLSIDEITYVPLREYSEFIEAKVDWSAKWNEARVFLPYARSEDVTFYERELYSLIDDSIIESEINSMFDESYPVVSNAGVAANIAISAWEKFSSKTNMAMKPLAVNYLKEHDLWVVGPDYNKRPTGINGAIYVFIRGRTGEVLQVHVEK